MISPHCLGGGKQIIPQGIQDNMPRESYANIMVANNDFYNNTAFLTLTNMESSYWSVKVSVSKSTTKGIEKTTEGMKGVIAIISIDSTEGKYYILCTSETFTHNRQAIDNVLYSLK